MGTLADPAARQDCLGRLARLDPSSKALWGRMNAPQMVCHLSDAFAVGAGRKYASPASNFLQRSVVKWIALRTSYPWPHGVPTRPEIEQGRGGTPPAEWERDCAELRRWIAEFPALPGFGAHPIFGPMNRRDWLVWGFKHVDHHFRQFGV